MSSDPPDVFRKALRVLPTQIDGGWPAGPRHQFRAWFGHDGHESIASGLRVDDCAWARGSRAPNKPYSIARPWRPPDQQGAIRRFGKPLIVVACHSIAIDRRVRPGLAAAAGRVIGDPLRKPAATALLPDRSSKTMSRTRLFGRPATSPYAGGLSNHRAFTQ